MNDSDKSQLYKEEFKFIFRGRGSSVRRATVISAFIEGQISSLASYFLEERNVVHKPKPYQEYNQSFYVSRVNEVLTPKSNHLKAALRFLSRASLLIFCP